MEALRVEPDLQRAKLKSIQQKYFYNKGNIPLTIYRMKKDIHTHINLFLHELPFSKTKINLDIMVYLQQQKLKYTLGCSSRGFGNTAKC